MASTVRVNADDGWVEVVHRGGLALREIEDARREAAELLARTGLSRLLIDGREADVSLLSIAEIYAFSTSHASALAATPYVRIAAIISEKQLEQSVFAETVARNRGIDLCIFVDPAEATRWLSK